MGCVESNRVDNRDFAIDTYYPTPNEVQWIYFGGYATDWECCPL
jgi:hypothetical protein